MFRSKTISQFFSRRFFDESQDVRLNVLRCRVDILGTRVKTEFTRESWKERGRGLGAWCRATSSLRPFFLWRSLGIAKLRLCYIISCLRSVSCCLFPQCARTLELQTSNIWPANATVTTSSVCNPLAAHSLPRSKLLCTCDKSPSNAADKSNPLRLIAKRLNSYPSLCSKSQNLRQSFTTYYLPLLCR